MRKVRCRHVARVSSGLPEHRGTAADKRSSGFFGKGDMQKEFEEVALGLQVGEVSHVVETASGLHIIERYV